MFQSGTALAVREAEPTLTRTPGIRRTPHASHEEIWQGPVCIRVADRPELREQASRLVHDVYVRCGYMKPNPGGRRVTPYDNLPGTTIFVACLDKTVIATLTLVADRELGLPLGSIYQEELQSLRREGRRLAEVTALADRREDPKRGMSVFLGMTKLMIHTARRRKIDDLLVTVHPKHARFYQRILVFEPFGPERAYPAVQNNPAVALRLDLRNVKANDQLSRRVLSRYFGRDNQSASVAAQTSASA